MTTITTPPRFVFISPKPERTLTTNVMDWPAFAKEIRIELRRREQTRREMAIDLGLSENTISNITRTGGCTVRNYLMICEWMNASPYDFLVEE